MSSTPTSTYDYDLATRERTLRKVQEIPSGHYAADYVRNLRGAYNVYLARLLIGVAYMVFYVAMLHGGGIIPSFHPARRIDVMPVVFLMMVMVVATIFTMFPTASPFIIIVAVGQ